MRSAARDIRMAMSKNPRLPPPPIDVPCGALGWAAPEGSVLAGAARAALSQPAVSMQPQQLAGIIGLECSSHVPLACLLTSACAALLQHAERAMPAQADFLQRAAHEGLGGGTLSVGNIWPRVHALGAFMRELVDTGAELPT